jgi:hypothetical protein
MGMAWADVAAQIEAEPNWLMIMFRGEPSACGFVSGGGGPTRNLPGSYELFVAGKGTRIKNLLDPGVVAQAEMCPTLVVAFHPSLSFSKVDFSIVFDSSGKVLSTTPTRTWD